MKKIVFILIAILSSTAVLKAQPSRTLHKVMELRMPEGGGVNAAGVAWEPVTRRYYAAMAGNASFSLGVFNETGDLLSPPDQTTLFDMRGIWYNSNTKTLEMNGYNDNGWAEYQLDEKGFPKGIMVFEDGLKQNSPQASGAYDPGTDFLYFLTESGSLEEFILAGGVYIDALDINLGQKSSTDVASADDAWDNFNKTTAVYTGITDSDLGLLNYVTKTIELYDIESGYLAEKLALPESAPVKSALNFAYCNGIYWLYDAETRAWKGYK